MRSLIYAYNISLDGYVEGPDGRFDWSEPDEEVHRWFSDLIRRFGTDVYGRRMWETMAPFWFTADQDTSMPDYIREFGSIWKQSEKIVVSMTLDHVDGGRLIKDNVVEEVRKLKQGDGKDISVGGATLAATLNEAGLIDEFMCMVHPVVIGGGKPMFMNINSPHRLKLVEVRHFNSGVVLLHYKKTDGATT
jgi:dihydrofolate reductase